MTNCLLTCTFSVETSRKMEVEKVGFKSIFEIVINLIVHFLLFGVSGLITFKSFQNGVTLFSWHPSLMVIGVSKRCNSMT